MVSNVPKLLVAGVLIQNVHVAVQFGEDEAQIELAQDTHPTKVSFVDDADIHRWCSGCRRRRYVSSSSNFRRQRKGCLTSFLDSSIGFLHPVVLSWTFLAVRIDRCSCQRCEESVHCPRHGFVGSRLPYCLTVDVRNGRSGSIL